MTSQNVNSDTALLYGNGFALKVYLPTLVNLGIKKVLIEKSQNLNVDQTNILNKYNEYILYFDKKDFQEKMFDYTILAVSPTKQYNLLLDNKFYKNTNTLILEKPMASSPNKAFEIIQKLEDLNIRYLINYSFRYASWYKNISTKIKLLPKDVELYFTWKFMARHFIHKRNTWKRFHLKGGGAIRFYGIHLIAILSDIGYLKVLSSNSSNDMNSDLSSFSCSLESTKTLPKCKIYINSKSKINEFSCYYIKDNKKISLLKLKEPFPKEIGVSFQDPRIEITKRFIYEKNFKYNNFNVINLWKAIEDKIVFNYSQKYIN